MKMNRVLVAIVLYGVVVLPACARQERDVERDQVHSVLTGFITVNPEIDSTKDYRGFEVLVAMDAEGEPDTLGYGVTDRSGAFAMDIVAPSRGRYSLLISRRGQILTMAALVVAQGDTASVKAVFPMGSRPIAIRSLENSAWMAYENTTAQHRLRLLELVQSEAYDEAEVGNLIRQSSEILWSLRETFPGTMGSEVAAVEAVSMVTVWDDSLALARALQIPPENVRYVEVARAARAAQSRLAGHKAAVALLESFVAKAVTELQRSMLEFEIVAAHLDSMRYAVALTEARAFKERYADTPYEQWGDRAIYELENLIPGKEAPSFSVRDLRGDSLHLADLLGRYVLLEFYHPQDDAYERELQGRDALYADAPALEIVSISMAADSLVSEVFFDSREIPGRHSIAPPGLAPLYNINVLPTRYLIDPEGIIVSKYVGSTMAAVYQELVGAP